MNQTALQRYVSQGEIAIGNTKGEIIHTLLGSCVSVCLHCPVARCGGMNHILLPDSMDSRHDPGIAIHAMESLINPMLRLGAQRGQLRAKIFGGAAMSGAYADIGAHNIEFVHSFLKLEAIEVVGQSVGGNRARRVKFWPEDGRAKQLLVDDVPVETVVTNDGGQDLELF